MARSLRALRLAGGIVLGVLLLLAAVFALAQTPPGRAWIAAALGRALAGPGERVTVSGLEGFVPFDLRVARIEIADAEGPRIIIVRAGISIAPADLLAGRLTVRRLAARDVEVRRLSSTPSHLELSSLLNPPLPLRLEQLHVDRLALGPALIGEPVAVTLNASGRLGGGSAAADLELRRIDATPGEAKLHFALSGTPPVLDLSGDVEEPSGRLLADALGKSEPLPIVLHLAGRGPLADWRGGLAFHAGTQAALDAAFRIRGNAGYRVSATGNAQLAALLPARLQPLLAGTLDFSAALDLSGDEIRLTDLTLSESAARFNARGAFARNSGALSGQGKLNLPDLAPLSALAGGRLGGTADLSLALGGTLEAPRARLTLAGGQLAFDHDRIASAGATIDLGAMGNPSVPATPIEISASGDLRGVVPGATALPGGLGERLDWRLGAQFDRAAKHLALNAIEIEDAGSEFVARAAGGVDGLAGEATLHVPDIGRFTGGTSGALAVAADFRAAADGSATAVVSGTLDAPRSGTGAVDRLLGEKATITATVTRAADGVLSASDISIEAANANFAGSGSRSATGNLDAHYHLALPRLAALGPQLAGSASITGTLSGSPQALTASATLSGEALRAGNLNLDHLEAQASIADLAKLSGTLDVRFSRAGLNGTASTAAALAGDTLRLSRIRLDAARTHLAGDLALSLSGKRIAGSLTGTAPDLKPWSPLLGTPVAGSAALEARLSGDKEQSADVTLNGKALSLKGMRAERLRATVRLTQLATRPAGRVEIAVEQATLGKATVASLSLTGEAQRPGRFALNAKAHGKAGEAYTLDTSGNLRLDGNDIELRVTRLAGALGKLPVELDKPLLLTRRGDDLAFAGLDLSFGTGRVAGDGSLKRATLTLHIRGSALPVHSLAELGGQQNVSGTLSFEATLAGSLRQPEGRLVVDGEELRLAGASRPDLAPLGLVLSADWRGGVVTAQGRLAGPDNAALGFTGHAPLLLDPQTLRPHLPPQGAVALHLEGGGELAKLSDVLPLGEDRLAGRFAVDVTVGGSVAAPEASGKLTVRDGRYESLYWGTTLTGMSFDLVGDRDRLVLEHFRAGDGATGSLALSGAVDLAGPAGPRFDVSGSFKSFRAVQRDEATATVSGDITLAGTLDAPRLGARLSIDHAELRVPDRLPQNVRPVAATVINSATGQVLSTPEETQAHVSLLSLALDVSVELPGQVFVRGRGLDSEWRGHLHVTGTTAQPTINGKLEVVHGTYNFLGRTATLSSGTITFLGGKRIDPGINIEARASSTDIVAIVQITGTATRPSIRLSSEPQLPQDEILSRLLFGTSVSKISPAEGFELAQAAAALATGGDPSVLDRIRQGLGLDRLSLSSASASSTLSNVTMPTTPAGVPSAFPTAGVGSAPTPLAATGGGGGVGATTVSAGKYVANGVYVGVVQGLGTSSSAVNVQIDVTRHISIETTAGGQDVGTGVGVNWKLDY